MTEFPVSRLKFPLAEHFAQINQSTCTMKITLCFVHRKTVEESLCYPVKFVILNSLIFSPFSVDSTDSIGVCNSKQACYWKCQQQWSFIENQQILASLKSLFAWFCNQIDLVTEYRSAAKIWTMSESKRTAIVVTILLYIGQRGQRS